MEGIDVSFYSEMVVAMNGEICYVTPSCVLILGTTRILTYWSLHKTEFIHKRQGIIRLLLCQ